MVEAAQQLSLLDSGRARDLGMGVANAYAHAAWKLAADRAIEACAGVNEYFISDDVHPFIPNDFRTHNLRALGPRLLAAQRVGLITPAGYTRTSRTSAHRTPVTRWRSLIFRRAA